MDLIHVSVSALEFKTVVWGVVQLPRESWWQLQMGHEHVAE